MELGAEKEGRSKAGDEAAAALAAARCVWAGEATGPGEGLSRAPQSVLACTLQ